MGAVYTGGDIGTQSNYIVEPKKRIPVVVPYNIGKDLFISQRCKIQFPHQTNDNEIEAMVESWNHDLNAGTTALRLILFGETESVSVYIQDTFGTGVDPDWQDSYEEQAIHEGGADTQDIS